MRASTPASETTPDFESERLAMRLLTARDEELFLALYTDPHTMQFIGPALTEEAARRMFARALQLVARSPRRHEYFTVATRCDGEELGMLSIQQMDDVAGCVLAGIVLLPTARARGFAREAMQALVDRALLQPAIAEVKVQIAAGNVAAQRLAVSLGFGRDPHDAPERRLVTWSIRRATTP